MAKKNQSADQLVKARVLVDCAIGGVVYKPNAVVEAAGDVIAHAVANGLVDSNEAAVAYAEWLQAEKQG